MNIELTNRVVALLRKNRLCYYKPMENKTIRIRKTLLKDQGKEPDLREITPSERFAMVSQITMDLWAFKGEKIAQQGLSRHIESLYRRGS